MGIPRRHPLTIQYGNQPTHMGREIFGSSQRAQIDPSIAPGYDGSFELM